MQLNLELFDRSDVPQESAAWEQIEETARLASTEALARLIARMLQAELYILRARLNGEIQNKAARGELRRGLPVGFVWGEADGEVRFHPDEAVVAAVRCVFARFAEMGSARRVWLWFRPNPTSSLR
jgi:DNA invertase Pin-like site-specific DNA recombinase